MARSMLRKAVDDVHQVRCNSGTSGILREEVYVDRAGSVAKYNLAFVHFGLCQKDHGRVLGYDNAHGGHERHWMRTVEPVAYESYEQTLTCFLDEIESPKERA